MTHAQSLRAALAAELHEIRWQKKLTQHDLAIRMKVADAYVSAVLTGRKSVEAKAINKFAKALSATPAERRRLHKLGARAQGWEV